MKKKIFTLLVIIFLASYGTVSAAIARTQFTSNGGDNATTLTAVFGSNVTANNTIICAIASYYKDSVNPPQAFTITDSLSNSYLQAANYQFASQGATEIFYASSITGGADTVTVHANVAAYFTVNCAEYSGLAASSAFDVSTSNQAAAGATYTSTAVTTTQASELLFGSYFTYSTGPTVTPSGSWSNPSFSSNHDSFMSGFVQDQIVSSTGSYANTGSVTGNSSFDSTVIATFKAAASVTATPLQSYSFMGGIFSLMGGTMTIQ